MFFALRQATQRMFSQSARRPATEPVLRPIRRVMPDTGAVDFSPMVFMLLLVAVSKMLQAATY